MISTQALNAAPLLQDETVTVIAGVPVTATPALLLANDSDPDGDPLGIVRYGQPSHGSLVIHPDDSITYTANPGYSGSDSFTYVVSDGQGHESTATVYLNVQAAQANQAPTVLDETVAVQAGVPVTGTPAMLLANDSDPDGDALSVTRYGQPAHGSLVVNPDGSITYTANAGYNGSDSFTYVVSDGQGHETVGTVNFNVTAPANQAPVVQGEFLSLQAGVPVTGTPADLLVNDSDPDGDTLRVLRYGTPSVGTLVQNPDGTITYTPPANFNGQATWTYVVGDGRGGETTGTVTFDISGGFTNTNPVAANDSATVVQDGSVRVAVLGNDRDLDGDSLSVSQVGTPGHGVATLNPDGTITYVPALGFAGWDSFSYTVSDGRGGSQSAQVSVTVQASAPDLLASSDTGSSNSDNITATTRPSFVVPSPPVGSVVVLLVDGVETAATFNASAKTLVPNLALSEGDHSVAYAFKPSAGGALTLTSAALGVTIDAIQEAPTLAPDLLAASDTGSSQSDNLTNLNRPLWAVGALPKAGDQANLYVDGVKLASTYDPAAGTLTPTLALSSAAHTIAWSITNAAGVESSRSTGLVVTVDTQAPATPAALDLQTASDTGSSGSDNITANHLPSFTVAALGVGDTVSLLVDGVEVVSSFVATTRTLTPVNALADGVHQVSVRLTDAAGNVSAAASALSVDVRTRPPEVSKAPDLQAGSDDGSSNSDDLTRVTLPVFAIPAPPAGTTAALWVDGVKVAATYTTGTLKPTVALTEGNHWISYTLTDTATGAVSEPSPSLALRIGGDPALMGSTGRDEFLVMTAEDETRLQVSLNDAQSSVQSTPTLHQVIWTGAGNDLVDAGDGDDWLDLGETAGALHSGTGQAVTATDVQATVLMSEVDWRLTNSWGSWVSGTLRNSGSDAGTITDWANVANAGWGQDVLKGGQGVDLLYGNEGDDWLMGAAGTDGLRGGVGDDTLRGGQGSDVLRGDDGRDTLVWMAGDAGAAGAPAQDRVLDFHVGPAAEEGDVLDLRDLLVGELPGAGGLLGNLASYLQIDASSSAGTLIHISSTGQLVPGGQVAGFEDQTVFLSQLDLRAALHLDVSAGNAQVIEAWLHSGGLQLGP